MVWRVWTRSLTRPVSGTVRLATGDSAGAPELFPVDADTALWVGGRHAPVPRPCACVCPASAGSGGPTSWARSGAPHLSFGLSWCALCLFGPPGAQVAPFVVVFGFFFVLIFPFFPSPPPLRPRCVLLSCFPAPGALGLGAFCPPPPLPPSFFPLPPPLCVPRCLLSCVFSGFGCLGPWRLVAPTPPPPQTFTALSQNQIHMCQY